MNILKVKQWPTRHIFTIFFMETEFNLFLVSVLVSLKVNLSTVCITCKICIVYWKVHF